MAEPESVLIPITINVGYFESIDILRPMVTNAVFDLWLFSYMNTVGGLEDYLLQTLIGEVCFNPSRL